MLRKELLRIKRNEALCEIIQGSTTRDLRDALEVFSSSHAVILIDAGFAKARPDLKRIISGVFPKARLIKVPSGEKAKSWEFAGKVLGQMIEAGLTRKDLCIAVGGGVVGDLAGFVASVYLRGIRVIHVPTTLLAMVDSSVGGKTALNHAKGKNLVGSFHQPVAVIQILDLIRTLPEADFKSGLGEVFKYAVGFDAVLFRELSRHSGEILRRDPGTLGKLIERCVRIKAKIVSEDEREAGSSRKASLDRRLLNLGHTLGHGLEKAYALPHGEAVAIGVTLAAKLSAKFQSCPQKCYHDIVGLARELGLRTDADFEWSLARILPYVKKDKKVSGGRVQFVCLRAIGKAFVRVTDFRELKLSVIE